MGAYGSTYLPQEVLERYEVQSHVGRAGPDETYLVVDLEDGEERILRFARDCPTSPRQRRHLEESYFRLSRIRHPALAVVRDFGLPVSGGHYVAHDFVPGANLRNLSRHMDFKALADVLAKLLPGLHLLHLEGFVHQRITPEKIIVNGLGPDRRVVLIDTPISPRRYGQREAPPEYRAPELDDEDGSFDGRADLYSLAVVVHEVTSGALPFGDRKGEELLQVRQQRDLPPPRAMATDCPPRFEELLLRMGAREPSFRPDNALRLAQALPRTGLLGSARPTLDPEILVRTLQHRVLDVRVREILRGLPDGPLPSKVECDPGLESIAEEIRKRAKLRRPHRIYRLHTRKDEAGIERPVRTILEKDPLHLRIRALPAEPDRSEAVIEVDPPKDGFVEARVSPNSSADDVRRWLGGLCVGPIDRRRAKLLMRWLPWHTKNDEEQMARYLMERVTYTDGLPRLDWKRVGGDVVRSYGTQKQQCGSRRLRFLGSESDLHTARVLKRYCFTKEGAEVLEGKGRALAQEGRRIRAARLITLASRYYSEANYSEREKELRELSGTELGAKGITKTTTRHQHSAIEMWRARIEFNSELYKRIRDEGYQDNDQNLELLRKTIRHSVLTSTERRAATLYARLLMHNNEIKRARRTVVRSARSAIKAGDLRHVGTATMNLGMIEYRRGRKDRARQWAKNALRSSEIQGQYGPWMFKASMDFESRRYIEAAYGDLQALRTARRNGDNPGIRTNTHNIVESMMRIGRYENARKWMDRAEGELRAEFNTDGLAEVLALEVLALCGNVQRFRDRYLKALDSPFKIANVAAVLWGELFPKMRPRCAFKAECCEDSMVRKMASELQCPTNCGITAYKAITCVARKVGEEFATLSKACWLIRRVMWMDDTDSPWVGDAAERVVDELLNDGQCAIAARLGIVLAVRQLSLGMLEASKRTHKRARMTWNNIEASSRSACGKKHRMRFCMWREAKAIERSLRRMAQTIESVADLIDELVRDVSSRRGVSPSVFTEWREIDHHASAISALVGPCDLVNLKINEEGGIVGRVRCNGARVSRAFEWDSCSEIRATFRRETCGFFLARNGGYDIFGSFNRDKNLAVVGRRVQGKELRENKARILRSLCKGATDPVALKASNEGKSASFRSGEGVSARERQCKEEAGLIYKSERMGGVVKTVKKLATNSVPVVLVGESGTGKELLAHIAHLACRGVRNSFVAVDCPSLAIGLAEAELFGHTRGAFTGALSERTGLLERASGGTLFLDEVADLDAGTQAKLLRALGSGEYRALGKHNVSKTQCYVVSATNVDLRGRASRGEFRADLYHRLGVEVSVPALRERREDILPIWERALREATAGAATYEEDVVELLLHYSWPGNVRELLNVAKACGALSEGREIGADLVEPLLLVDRRHTKEVGRMVIGSRIERAMRMARKAGRVDRRTYMRWMAVSPRTALRDLAQLVKLGRLRRAGSGRGTKYVPTSG